ncbi:MAG TPA: hypothetical protein VGH09_06605 [Solirubrobacteraceae bacterium]|jgi:hypothetical protein
MSDAASLDERLRLALAVVSDAATFQRQTGQATSHTRKHPQTVSRELRRWRSALQGDTVKPKTGATAPQAGSQRQADAVTACRREEPAVPVSPTVAVRVPVELREQAEAYGREHRWTFGEVTRVALEQLVGFEQDDEDSPDRQVTA